MSLEDILRSVREHYGENLNKYGATLKGLGWNSVEAQSLRFEQLLKVCDTAELFSINDYGCGYGSLVDFMRERGFTFRYRGFDMSPQMIVKAKELHEGLDGCEFFDEQSLLTQADYTVASGIFNIRLRHGEGEWKEYVLQTLGRMAGLSAKGFAFNMLTEYSDPDRMRPDLYYGDPCFFFDYCKRKFSKWVALLHDYRLYDFTVIVRK